MTKIAPFFLACLLALLAKPALADRLQILKGGTYVAYATYSIGTARGRTDRYGRMTVSLPNGTYQGNIVYRDKHYSISVEITGARDLRKVTLKP